MDNSYIIKQLHKTLHDLIEILRESKGLDKFPTFLYIYKQVSLALDDPEALSDLVFLDDIKASILGMYSAGGTGTFLDYVIWKDDDIEARQINEKFNHLSSELPKLARSLQTRGG